LCRHASVFIKLKTGRFSEPFSRQVRARFEHEKLVGTFQPHGFSGRVLLILTEDPGDKYRVGARCGWEEAIEGALTCRLVSGNHLEIFSQPHLDRLVWHTDEFLNPDTARRMPKSMVSDKVVTVGSDELPNWSDQLAKFPKTGE
jgi:thioesterase domain-containing protein